MHPRHPVPWSPGQKCRPASSGPPVSAFGRRVSRHAPQSVRTGALSLDLSAARRSFLHGSASGMEVAGFSRQRSDSLRVADSHLPLAPSREQTAPPPRGAGPCFVVAPLRSERLPLRAALGCHRGPLDGAFQPGDTLAAGTSSSLHPAGGERALAKRPRPYSVAGERFGRGPRFGLGSRRGRPPCPTSSRDPTGGGARSFLADPRRVAAATRSAAGRLSLLRLGRLLDLARLARDSQLDR